jgi:hypothetical protein
LRDAVVDAGSVGGGLWLSYLFVFFYLAIAAGGVTHRDLLFENPVKLPFLNIDLPLIGFFVNNCRNSAADAGRAAEGWTEPRGKGSRPQGTAPVPRVREEGASGRFDQVEGAGRVSRH